MKKRNKGKDNIGYLMILPFYAIFLYIYFIPLFVTLINSFTNSQMFGDAKFIGFNNYIAAFNDEYFVQATVNTLVYVFFSLSISMVLGFALALIINNKLVKTRFARVAFFIPHTASMVSVSIIWIWLFDERKGFINFFINLFGVENVNWLGSADTALGAIIFMSVWKIVGYNMIVNLSGLQAIPIMYKEAALIDGASKYQILKYITIPLLSPTTFFLLTTGLISSFTMFEQVNIMTGGGPLNSTTTIVHQIYTRAFLKFQVGYASAQSVLLIFIILICLFFVFRFVNRGNDLDM